MNKLITHFKINAILTSIVLVFLIEFALTLYLNYESVKSTRLVGFYKIILQIIIISSITYRNINRPLLYFIISIFLIFLINQIILNPIFFDTIEFQLKKGSLYYFDRYIYIYLFIVAFLTWKKNIYITKTLIKIIEIILLFNSVLMIIGFCFDINLFESYPNSSRFGYDGLFNKVNETSYLYIMYISYLYYQVINKIRKWPILIFMIGVSLLMGTKTILLFLALLFVYHCTMIIKYKNYCRIAIIVLSIVFFLFFKQIMYFYFDLFPFWNHLQAKHGLTTLLFSKRDLLFLDNVEYIKVFWNYINYIIGGPYYSSDFLLTQMDSIDLFLFFGILGVALYSFFIGKMFFEKNNNIKNSLMIIIFFCGLIGGGLLLSTMSMIYLFLISKYMSLNPQKEGSISERKVKTQHV